MTKNNNKGFSLIELIIAVAVMAILITPIIRSVAQTLNNSASAKERQYVNDNAELVMEYFKKNSVEDLVSGKVQDPTLQISTIGPEQTKQCMIVQNGAASGTSTDYVEYKVRKYTLADEHLGRKKTTYSRTVFVDDLNNKLLEKGYRMSADIDKNSTFASEVLGSSWTFTENMGAVQYDTEGCISAAVVDAIPGGSTTYTDPNLTNLGAIQDLDVNKMAIISGDETEYDQSFENDFISSFIKQATENKAGMTDSAWESYSSQLSTLAENALNDGVFSRVFVINVTKNTSTSTVSTGYHVSIDLNYRATFDVARSGSSSSATDQVKENFHYNLMSKDFFTTSAPDVLIEYEPFILDHASSYSKYSYVDYIVASGDSATSGQDVGESPSKVYIIKPDNTWQKVNTKDLGGMGFGTAYSYDDPCYYTYEGATTNPSKVKINVNTLGSQDNALQIVTNLEISSDTFDKSLCTYNASSEGSRSNPSTPELIGYTNTGRFEYPSTITWKNTGSSENVDSIIKIEDDKRYSGKLYRIHLLYVGANGHNYEYTGAKGAQ